MRSTQLTTFLVLVVLTAGFFAQLSRGAPPVLARRIPVVAAQKVSFTVEGYGATVENAERLALEKAHDQVAEQLAALEPPVTWRPDLDYVNRRLVKNRAVDKPQVDGLPGNVLRVRLSIDLEPHLADIRREDLHLRMEQRQMFLAKVMAAIVVLCTAIFGYVRLDEATKGYYANWLRLGVLGLVGGTGAALWLTR